MTFLIKRVIRCCFLLLAFYSLTPSDIEFVNAREEVQQKVEDIKLVAGVEEIFNIEPPIKISSYNLIGYTTAKINIREYPSTDSKIVETIPFNTEIQYEDYNSEWAAIKYNNMSYYIYKEYISDKTLFHYSYDVPDNTGFKSYMSYKAITNKSSKQFKIQQKAYTGDYGIRMVGDRYCIALGTYFDAPIGTYVDLILENGTKIHCIVSEIKSNQHTNLDNIVTSHNGCVAEFIVDTDILNTNAKRNGDISYCQDNWKSPVETIKVYNKNILN